MRPCRPGLSGMVVGPARWDHAHRREEAFQELARAAVGREHVRVRLGSPDGDDNHVASVVAAREERLDIVAERDEHRGVAIAPLVAQRDGTFADPGARCVLRRLAVRCDPRLDVVPRPDTLAGGERDQTRRSRRRLRFPERRNGPSPATADRAPRRRDRRHREPVRPTSSAWTVLRRRPCGRFTRY